jgi:ATP-dependent RNA helicase DOB1
MADKRPARDEGLPRTAKAAKLQRLGDDLVAEGRGGVNVITVGGKSCTHEVCWPPGEAGSSAPPPKHAGPPARQYPFPLDPFQTTAIDALEAGKPHAARAMSAATAATVAH